MKMDKFLMILVNLLATIFYGIIGIRVLTWEYISITVQLQYYFAFFLFGFIVFVIIECICIHGLNLVDG